MRDYARGSHEIFNIESVEVSKDPGSIYSGRGSTGGTINLITKKPKRHLKLLLSIKLQVKAKQKRVLPQTIMWLSLNILQCV